MNKCLLVSCNPTDHIINPDPKLFIDSMREGRGESIFDSCELTSNQLDNFKTCLSLSCRVNISNFDVFLFSWFYTLQYCNALQFLKNNNIEISRCVCETLQYAPGGNKFQRAIFSFKVKVKVTRSLTLVSIERASLVEYACQVWSLYLLWFKSYREG